MKKIIIPLFISFLLISCWKSEEIKQESSVNTTNSWVIQTWSIETKSWITEQTWTSLQKENIVYQTYQDKKLWIEFKYPNDWIKVSDIKDIPKWFSNDSLSLYKKSVTQTYPDSKFPLDGLISINMIDNPKNISLQEIFKNVYENCLKEEKKLELKWEPSAGCPLNPDTSKWKQLTVDWKQAIQDTTWYSTFISGNSVYIQLPNKFLNISILYYNDKQTSQLSNIFDEFISNFKFINQWGIELTVTTFSDIQIKDILAKIDENIKKQQELEKNSTWSLIQWDFKAEYISNNFDINKADSFIITKNWISKTLPGLYNPNSTDETDKSRQKEFNLLQSKGFIGKDQKDKLEKRWVSVGLWVFDWFVEFSPSWNYILYNIGSWGGKMTILMDTQTWKEVIKEIDMGYHDWTLDKKQFIYWTTSWIVSWKWLLITKKWGFPEVETIEKDDVLWWYVDNNYLYIQLQGTKNYLKIYDLKTLKEVFSKKIQ